MDPGGGWIGGKRQEVLGQGVIVQDVTVSDARIGVFAMDTSGLVVQDSVFKRNPLGGLVWVGGSDGVLQRNKAQENDHGGVMIADVDGVSVLDNRFIDHAWNGLDIWGSTQILVTGNQAHGNRNGFSLWDSPGASLAHNDLVDNLHGVQVRDSPGVEFQANEFLHNFFAVFVSHSDGMMLRGNNIQGNLIGIWAFGSGSVDAKKNWWGHPTGPSPLLGFPSTLLGLGDPVVGNVDYVPWLLEPNPDAGA